MLLAALAALTAIRLAVAATTHLAPDEAYYWLWSRTLQPGYLDDSPMVALFTRLGTAIAGPTPLGIRLLGPLVTAFGSILIWHAASDFFPGHPRAGTTAASLVNATLLLGVGSVIMTPDTPLIFFWTLGLFALGRLIASGDERWWWLTGLAAGLALDSKYTAALFIVAVGLWLLASPNGRPWLRRPGPWLALILALLLFTPVVTWNALHHWASFLKQGGRVGAWRPADALRFQLELIGGQIGLFTPLIFILAVAGTWRQAVTAWRETEPGAELLTLLTLVPAVVFIEHGFGDRVQGNWPAVLYPSALLAAAALAGPASGRLKMPAAVLGLVMTGFVYVQAVAHPFALPARLDPTLPALGGWSAMAERIADLGNKNWGARHRAAFIAADNYGAAAELAILGQGPLPVIGIGPRWLLFRLPPAQAAIAGRSGLLMERRGAAPPDPNAWTLLAPPVPLTRARGGQTADSYLLYRVRAGRHITGAVLPTP